MRRELPPRARRLLRGRDVAVLYAIVVVVVAAYVFLQPDRDTSRLVLDSSTNLENLRAQPVEVLLLSAFVISSPYGLWILVPTVWAYGICQRWLGRAATIWVGVFGHVFSTVFVSVLLTAGIASHRLDRSLAREPDVGVSYGLAAVLGILTYRLSPARRRLVAAVATGIFVGFVAVSETFTDLGHLVAWAIGLVMGAVGRAVSDAGNAARADSETR